MILPVEDATGAASDVDVNVMSGMHDIGT